MCWSHRLAPILIRWGKPPTYKLLAHSFTARYARCLLDLLQEVQLASKNSKRSKSRQKTAPETLSTDNGKDHNLVHLRN